MKRKVLSIVMTLVMVLTACLVTTLPAVADTSVKEAAVLLAADRLVTLQNGDGGFPWTLPDSIGTSYTNVCGVSAMGILKAWNIDPKADYNTALAKAYKYVVDMAPTYIWSTDKYIESPKGVDSDPDITFLLGLASAADCNPALLDAINGMVSGTTAADIAVLAKSRWDTRNLYLGSTQEIDPNGTATGYAIWERDLRHGTDGHLDSLIPWNLELAVEAALALNDTYPDEGYNTQADEITVVLNDSIDDASGVYFNSTDTSQEDYIAGLTGAVAAFAETGLFQGKAADLLTLLLEEQLPDGSWLFYESPDTASDPQDTAYSVMALFKMGTPEAVVAANAGADWLVSNQVTTGDMVGGWLTYDGINEYAEVDSEAACALAMAANNSLYLKGGNPYSTYAFEYTVPGTIVATENVIVPVAFETDDLGTSSYDAVRFAFAKTAGPGNVTFKAYDGYTWYTAVNSGYWGPETGFPLAADYAATTDWTLNFSAAGTYTISFNCFEIGKEGEPFAEDAVEVTVQEPTRIGVSVTPTSIDFGALKPGVASTGHTVTVTNTGNVAEDFAASLTNISTPDVYTSGLTLGGSLVSAWSATGIAVEEFSDPELVLTIPIGTAPGTYTATVVFWAEAD